MSHSEALPCLTVGNWRSEMFRWALRKGIDGLRVIGLLAAFAIVGGFGLTAPAAADVSVEPAAVSVYTMSPGRIAASMAAVVALVGAVVAGLALARSGRVIGTANGRRGAIVALVLGPIGVVIG